MSRPELIIIIISSAVFILLFPLKRIKSIKQNVTALFIVRLIRIICIISTVLSLLSLIPGFERGWKAILTGSGIMAVVLGLAAQSSLANIFAGMAISSVNRPFDIGDRVKIGDVEPGFVRNITLRHVELITYMGQTVIIPNSVVQSAVIINYTKEDGNAYPLEITVAYGCDLNKAIAIFEEAVNTHPKHYGNPCTVLVKEAADYGIVLKGTVMTKDFMDTTVVCSECLKIIIERYQTAGIEIPYPITDVILHTGKAQQTPGQYNIPAAGGRTPHKKGE